jgi:low temperature requirement protein LtrA
MTDTATPGGVHSPAKRVAWVELYFDLVFVVAVAQVAEVIVEEPTRRGLLTALGLFALLWWTWVGYTTLFNRHGVETSQRQRLFVVVSTIPCGIAAIAVHEAAAGDFAPLGLALVAARLLLVFGHAVSARAVPMVDRPPQRRTALGYLLSAILIGVGVAVGGAGLTVLWILAVLLESAALLGRGDQELRRARQQHNPSLLAPTEAGTAVEPHHFAERFGLFIIILLGEVVASAQGALFGPDHDWTSWVGLALGIGLGGALWWLYFDSAVELNARLLELAGGSPAMANALYAGGHIPPAFGLLLVAAGTRLLLDGSPSVGAYSLLSTGLGLYLATTKVLLGRDPRQRTTIRFLRIAVVVLTFQFGWLLNPLGPTLFLAVVCGWAILCATLATLGRGDSEMVTDQF